VSPGLGFGEPAAADGAVRTAFVRADEDAVCWVLSASALHALEATHPLIKIRVLENLLRSNARIVDRLTREAVAERF
jgi:CRP-like cAMP-binding protein